MPDSLKCLYIHLQESKEKKQLLTWSSTLCSRSCPIISTSSFWIWWDTHVSLNCLPVAFDLASFFQNDLQGLGHTVLELSRINWNCYYHMFSLELQDCIFFIVSFCFESNIWETGNFFPLTSEINLCFPHIMCGQMASWSGICMFGEHCSNPFKGDNLVLSSITR